MLISWRKIDRLIALYATRWVVQEPERNKLLHIDNDLAARVALLEIADGDQG